MLFLKSTDLRVDLYATLSEIFCYHLPQWDLKMSESETKMSESETKMSETETKMLESETNNEVKLEPEEEQLPDKEQGTEEAEGDGDEYIFTLPFFSHLIG